MEELVFLFFLVIGIGGMMLFAFIASVALIRANRNRREALETLEKRMKELERRMGEWERSGGVTAVFAAEISSSPEKAATVTVPILQAEVGASAASVQRPTVSEPPAASTPAPSPVESKPDSEMPESAPSFLPAEQIKEEAPLPPSKVESSADLPAGDLIPPATSPSPAESLPPAAFSIPSQEHVFNPKSFEVEKPQWRLKLEKQFMENWTGVLGSVILVMGAAFLAIYAALQLVPVYRFFMIAGFSAVLFVVFMVLRSREKWEKLGVWLRSSGCALYLFACVGAVGIPGLQFVETRVEGMLILLSGVVVNLFAAMFSGSQFFASFHGLLSLIALAIAPAEPITLIIGAVIALASVFQTYRSRWEYHLFVSISAFLIYHVYWYYHAYAQFKAILPLPLRALGVAVTLVIGMSAAIVHYRRIYADPQKNRLPFFVHLMNWFYMAFGFYLYSTGSKWNTFVLMCASLAAFALSRRARRLGVRWLFVMDSLIAESIAIIAVITIHRLDVSILPLLLILILQIAIFMLVHLHEQEPVLKKTGVIIFNLSIVLLLGVSYVKGASSGERLAHEAINDVITLGIALALLLGIHLYLTRRFGEELDCPAAFGESELKTPFYSISGALIGLSPLVFPIMMKGATWAMMMTAGILSGLMLLGRRLNLNGLYAGIIISTTASFPVMWFLMLNPWTRSASYYLGLGALLFLLALLGLYSSYRPHDERYEASLWVHLFGIHYLVYTFKATVDMSPLAPGLIWLASAPAALALGRLKRLHDPASPLGRSDLPRYIWHWSFLFLLAFIPRFFVSHLQAFSYLGPLTYRFWTEILAIIVLLWWASQEKPEYGEKYFIWKRLHPIMWELALIAATATIAMESMEHRLPFIWSAAAFAMFGLSLLQVSPWRRFRLYAVFYYWTGLYYAVVISSTIHSPSPSLLEQPWFIGAASLLILCGFALLFRLKSDSPEMEFPVSLAALGRFYQQISLRRNRWIFYPYFIATALFLYWTFSSALLTLLWVAETFVIFIMSLILRENQFRYLSMAGLAACLGRLLFFDMARSDTIARALVFLGVGALMIGMNALYNKYKERFDNEHD